MSNNTITQSVWTHGHHLEIEHPERTSRILRWGGSILVEGSGNQQTWLHGTITTPTDAATERIRVWVRPRGREEPGIAGAEITAIHVWDGDRRIGTINNLLASSQGYTTTPLEICLTRPIQWGIGVSIRVKFKESRSRIEISAIGCEFKAGCSPAQFRITPVVVASERFPVRISTTTLYQPFASQFEDCSHQLFTYNPAVRRIVYSFHGVGANANQYCQRMARAAEAADATGETLIVAPQFLNLYDEREPVEDILEVLAAESDLLYWTGGRFDGGRFDGGCSANHEHFPRTGGHSIASFDVIDRMLQHCVQSGLFPNLNTVVLVGQSGGGQLVHRYAASSTFSPPDGIHIRYIPMNPGSYLYMSNRRHHPQVSHPVATDAPVNFTVPDDAASEYAVTWAYGGSLPSDPSFDLAAEKAKVLERYNIYGLGLARVLDMPYHRNAHGSNHSEAVTQIRENYQKRAIVHLVGELDNKEEPSSKDLGLVLHGRSRLERARLYRHHLINEGLWNPSNHVQREVEGVGHDGGKMMLSDEGLWYIFGYKAPSNNQLSTELDWLSAEVWMLSRFLERMRTSQPAISGGSGGERTFVAQLERARATLKNLRQEVERPIGRYLEPPYNP